MALIAVKQYIRRYKNADTKHLKSQICIAKRNTKVYNNKKRKVGVDMANKSANVMARVEPQIKEQAELIMSKLGVPTSVLINMLYKQIIMTKSIPFSLSIPDKPVARDEMSEKQFNEMMEKGLAEAKADQSKIASEVFNDIRQGIN